jgi:DNA-binding SARP family transcriptional activator
MSSLTLQLLGPFAASYDCQPLTHFRTRAVQALLIYLVCRPEAHRRESLMALLWPGVTQESAQNSLRQTLYHLRRAVPEVSTKSGDETVPFVLADRQIVQVNPEAAYALDAALFERTLKGPQEE